jgi:hypothetical protein
MVIARWVVGAVVAAASFEFPQAAWAQAAPLAAIGPVVEILLTEYAFGPSDLAVPTGPFVLRIVNVGIRRQNLVMLVDGVECASPEVRPGDVVEWELRIDRPGSYLFWCGEYRHLEKGIHGTLTAT